MASTNLPKEGGIQSTPITFNIPKIKTKCTGVLNSVSRSDRQSLELIREVDRTCLDPDMKIRKQWQNTTVCMISAASHVECRYREKRAEMKELCGGRQQQEVLGFYICRDRQLAAEIARNGIKVNAYVRGCLGDPSQGVYLFRYLDVALLSQREKRNIYVVVFKVLQGRTKQILVSEYNAAAVVKEPTPNFDTHVSQSVPHCREPFSMLCNKSQMYVYEYTDDATPAEFPRQCLPFALLQFCNNGLGQSDAPFSFGPKSIFKSAASAGWTSVRRSPAEPTRRFSQENSTQLQKESLDFDGIYHKIPHTLPLTPSNSEPLSLHKGNDVPSRKICAPIHDTDGSTWKIPLEFESERRPIYQTEMVEKSKMQEKSDNRQLSDKLKPFHLREPGLKPFHNSQMGGESDRGSSEPIVPTTSRVQDASRDPRLQLQLDSSRLNPIITTGSDNTPSSLPAQEMMAAVQKLWPGANSNTTANASDSSGTVQGESDPTDFWGLTWNGVNYQTGENQHSVFEPDRGREGQLPVKNSSNLLTDCWQPHMPRPLDKNLCQSLGENVESDSPKDVESSLNRFLPVPPLDRVPAKSALKKRPLAPQTDSKKKKMSVQDYIQRKKKVPAQEGTERGKQSSDGFEAQITVPLRSCSNTESAGGQVTAATISHGENNSQMETVDVISSFSALLTNISVLGSSKNGLEKLEGIKEAENTNTSIPVPSARFVSFTHCQESTDASVVPRRRDPRLQSSSYRNVGFSENNTDRVEHKITKQNCVKSAQECVIPDLKTVTSVSDSPCSEKMNRPANNKNFSSCVSSNHVAEEVENIGHQVLFADFSEDMEDEDALRMCLDDSISHEHSNHVEDSDASSKVSEVRITATSICDPEKTYGDADAHEVNGMNKDVKIQQEIENGANIKSLCVTKKTECNTGVHVVDEKKNASIATVTNDLDTDILAEFPISRCVDNEVDVKESGIVSVDNTIDTKEFGMESGDNAIDVKEGFVESVDNAINVKEFGMESGDNAINLKEGCVESVDHARDVKEGHVESADNLIDVKEVQDQLLRIAKGLRGKPVSVNSATDSNLTRVLPSSDSILKKSRSRSQTSDISSRKSRDVSPCFDSAKSHLFSDITKDRTTNLCKSSPEAKSAGKTNDAVQQPLPTGKRGKRKAKDNSSPKENEGECTVDSYALMRLAKGLRPGKSIRVDGLGKNPTDDPLPVLEGAKRKKKKVCGNHKGNKKAKEKIDEQNNSVSSVEGIGNTNPLPVDAKNCSLPLVDKCSVKKEATFAVSEPVVKTESVDVIADVELGKTCSPVLKSEPEENISASEMGRALPLSSIGLSHWTEALLLPSLDPQVELVDLLKAMAFTGHTDFDNCSVCQKVIDQTLLEEEENLTDGVAAPVGEGSSSKEVAPMPLNNTLPLPLNDTSHLPLNDTSQLPLNDTSQLPLNNTCETNVMCYVEREEMNESVEEKSVEDRSYGQELKEEALTIPEVVSKETDESSSTHIAEPLTHSSEVSNEGCLGRTCHKSKELAPLDTEIQKTRQSSESLESLPVNSHMMASVDPTQDTFEKSTIERNETSTLCISSSGKTDTKIRTTEEIVSDSVADLCVSSLATSLPKDMSFVDVGNSSTVKYDKVFSSAPEKVFGSDQTCLESEEKFSHKSFGKSLPVSQSRTFLKNQKFIPSFSRHTRPGPNVSVCSRGSTKQCWQQWKSSQMHQKNTSDQEGNAHTQSQVFDAGKNAGYRPTVQETSDHKNHAESMIRKISSSDYENNQNTRRPTSQVEEDTKSVGRQSSKSNDAESGVEENVRHPKSFGFWGVPGSAVSVSESVSIPVSENSEYMPFCDSEGSAHATVEKKQEQGPYVSTAGIEKHMSVVSDVLPVEVLDEKKSAEDDSSFHAAGCEKDLWHKSGFWLGISELETLQKSVNSAALNNQSDIHSFSTNKISPTKLSKLVPMKELVVSENMHTRVLGLGTDEVYQSESDRLKVNPSDSPKLSADFFEMVSRETCSSSHTIPGLDLIKQTDNQELAPANGDGNGKESIQKLDVDGETSVQVLVQEPNHCHKAPDTDKLLLVNSESSSTEQHQKTVEEEEKQNFDDSTVTELLKVDEQKADTVECLKESKDEHAIVQDVMFSDEDMDVDSSSTESPIKNASHETDKKIEKTLVSETLTENGIIKVDSGPDDAHSKTEKVSGCPIPRLTRARNKNKNDGSDLRKIGLEIDKTGTAENQIKSSVYMPPANNGTSNFPLGSVEQPRWANPQGNSNLMGMMQFGQSFHCGPIHPSFVPVLPRYEHPLPMLPPMAVPPNPMVISQPSPYFPMYPGQQACIPFPQPMVQSMFTTPPPPLLPPLSTPLMPAQPSSTNNPLMSVQPPTSNNPLISVQPPTTQNQSQPKGVVKNSDSQCSTENGTNDQNKNMTTSSSVNSTSVSLKTAANEDNSQNKEKIDVISWFSDRESAVKNPPKKMDVVDWFSDIIDGKRSRPNSPASDIDLGLEPDTKRTKFDFLKLSTCKEARLHESLEKQREILDKNLDKRTSPSEFRDSGKSKKDVSSSKKQSDLGKTEFKKHKANVSNSKFCFKVGFSHVGRNKRRGPLKRKVEFSSDSDSDDKERKRKQKTYERDRNDTHNRRETEGSHSVAQSRKDRPVFEPDKVCMGKDKYGTRSHDTSPEKIKSDCKSSKKKIRSRWDQTEHLQKGTNGQENVCEDDMTANTSDFLKDGVGSATISDQSNAAILEKSIGSSSVFQETFDDTERNISDQNESPETSNCILQDEPLESLLLAKQVIMQQLLAEEEDVGKLGEIEMVSDTDQLTAMSSSVSSRQAVLISDGSAAILTSEVGEKCNVSNPDVTEDEINKLKDIVCKATSLPSRDVAVKRTDNSLPHLKQNENDSAQIQTISDTLSASCLSAITEDEINQLKDIVCKIFPGKGSGTKLKDSVQSSGVQKSIPESTQNPPDNGKLSQKETNFMSKKGTSTFDSERKSTNPGNAKSASIQQIQSVNFDKCKPIGQACSLEPSESESSSHIFAASQESSDAATQGPRGSTEIPLAPTPTVTAEELSASQINSSRKRIRSDLPSEKNHVQQMVLSSVSCDSVPVSTYAVIEGEQAKMSFEPEKTVKDFILEKFPDEDPASFSFLLNVKLTALVNKMPSKLRKNIVSQIQSYVDSRNRRLAAPEMQLDTFSLEQIQLELRIVKGCLRLSEATKEIQNMPDQNKTSFADPQLADEASLHNCHVSVRNALSRVIVDLDSVTKNGRHRRAGSLRGRAHQYIPHELLLNDEKKNLYTKEGIFVILFTDIPDRQYDKLLMYRKDIENCLSRIQHAACNNETVILQQEKRKLQQLQQQRMQLMKTFCGAVSLNRVRKLENLCSHYAISRDHLLQVLGKESVDKMLFLKTSLDAIQHHLDIVRQEMGC